MELGATELGEKYSRVKGSPADIANGLITCRESTGEQKEEGRPDECSSHDDGISLLGVKVLPFNVPRIRKGWKSRLLLSSGTLFYYVIS